MRKTLLLSIAAISIPALLAGCSQGEPAANDAAANEAVANEAVANETSAMVAVGTDNGATPAALGEGAQAKIVQLEKVATIPETPNDPVAVSDVKFSSGIAGNFITAKVKYGGGCRPHEFKAYWNGSWTKTQPPGIAITLRHNGNADTCEQDITGMVQISIAEPAATNKQFSVDLIGPSGSAGKVDVKIP